MPVNFDMTAELRGIELMSLLVRALIYPLIHTLIVCGLGARLTHGQEPSDADPPSLTPDETISRFVFSDEMDVSVFAAEPDVANPVALEVDFAGNAYVCETYRLRHGVEDNRDHVEWIDDDLAIRTLADREAMLKKHLGDDWSRYTERADQLRFLADTDNDGRADQSTVYAGEFNGLLDGPAAGVLHRKGTVYFGCVPKLWALRDDNGDGEADRRSVMHEGFGVKVSMLGHDLHGLCLGPDGRVYFSVGDRGYHVKAGDGVIADHQSGAVFRCEQDGSHMEVFATGLRNPQDLVFDDYANLFTADNNSDYLDRSRWVHVLQGGDSGWRMPYQYLPDRGPWEQEKLWWEHFPDQAAYIVPPIGHVGVGPSGLARHPGTGWPAYYSGAFLLCDFHGSSAGSAIRMFKNRTKGATFELVSPEVFLTNLLPTDLDFGPDSSLYVTDWVEGWHGSGKGRIYRIAPKGIKDHKSASQTQRILSNGFQKLEPEQLVELLAHTDGRVRLESQLELALRSASRQLAQVALGTDQSRLARVHAIWGLGQIARRSEAASSPLADIMELAKDSDAVIREQFARVVGDARYQAGVTALAASLGDGIPAVRYSACMALSRMEEVDGLELAIDFLVDKKNQEPTLRHAGMMLLGRAPAESIAELAGHANRTVRLAAIVALRRQRNPSVSMFLTDQDLGVLLEAARAIYDVPLDDAMAELAELVEQTPRWIDKASEEMVLPLVRRTLNAAARVGGDANARRLSDFATDPSQSLIVRLEALQMLDRWKEPSPRDRLTGSWWPADAHPGEQVVAALGANFEQLVDGGQDIRLRAARLAAKYGIADAAAVLTEIIFDTARDGRPRAGALYALGLVAPEDFAATLDRALGEEAPRLRSAARILLARRGAEGALGLLSEALESDASVEKQTALNALETLRSEEADQVILQRLQQLVQGDLEPEIQADVLVASRRRARDNESIQSVLEQYESSLAPANPLDRYRVALVGGDSQRGELIFRERAALSCL